MDNDLSPLERVRSRPGLPPHRWTKVDDPQSEAVIAAHDSDAQVQFDDATNNPHFSYVEDDGTKHDVWLLDAVTAYNQIHAADIYQPAVQIFSRAIAVLLDGGHGSRHFPKIA